MKPKLSAKQIARHQAAYQQRIARELCLDLAWKHTEQINSLNSREVLRQIAILGMPVPPESWHRELRQSVQFHYEQIACMLVCSRLKKKSWCDDQREALLNGDLTPGEKRRAQEQRRWLIDLTVAINDPSLSREARDRAAQQRKEMEKAMKDSEKQPLVHYFQSCEHLEPLAKFLSARLQRDGGEKLFPRLSRIVERYFNASYSTRDTWDRCRPLLCFLAVEWLRDDKALWKFVEAILVRWAKDVGDPQSGHRRSTVLHLTAQSTVLDHRHDWKRLAKYMVEIKAISPGVAGADHCLSQMSSDECAKALRVAKRKPRDKRDQLAPWRGALRHALSDSKVRATPAMPAL